MNFPSANFFEILRILSDHEVEYIVVGGVCGVLHGSPITTFDLDVLHSTKSPNPEKLLRALTDLDGWSRQHQKKIRPNKSHLEARGHLLLQTRFGPLDLLASVGKSRDYEGLLDHTVEGNIRDVTFRMLDLKTLILTKEETNRQKDRAVLPILRATLQAKR